MFTGIHRFWYRLSGGRIGGRFGKSPVLILTTTGRKSGQPRSTPLFYLLDDGRYVVVASNGGSDAPPKWWLNLQASPQATIEVGSEKIQVTAHEANEQDRQRLWPKLVAMYAEYATYEKRTTRQIPVVLLQPVDTE